MSTVIIRTNAGKAHDHAVRMGDAQPSAFKYIVGYKHEPIIDVLAIKDLKKSDLTQESLRREDFARTNLDDFSSNFKLVLSEKVEVLITAVAVELENGVTWGYAPYLAHRGGLDKSTDFIYELDLVTSEIDSDTLTITHELFDLREMRKRMLESISAADLLPFLQSTLIQNLVQSEINIALKDGIKAPELGTATEHEHKDTPLNVSTENPLIRQVVQLEMDKYLSSGLAAPELSNSQV